MDVKADAAVQLLQRRQPLHPRLGGLPAVGRHLKQSVNVLLTGQVDHPLHVAYLRIGKALVGGLLHLVGVRLVVEHLLQLPQVPFRRNDIQHHALRPQHTAKLLQRQRRKAVEEQLHAPVRHRQMIR